MRAVWRWLGWVVAGLVLAWGGLSVAGHWRWSSATRGLQEQLSDVAAPTPAANAVARFDPAELRDLPAPVQRYFRAVLTEGQALVSAVSIEHQGLFNMSEAAEDWKPFRSRQQVTTARPGFLWDARIAMLPGMLVRVHDAYIGGEGLLRAAVLGLVSVADLHGTREVAEGELMRWFAEAAWYPTALLPSQGVRWEAVDDRSARATVADGKNRVTLTFLFGDDDTMLGVRADARGRTLDGRTVPMPWEGRWSDTQLRDGMRVPMRGEVAWITPQGRKPYWQGQVTTLTYEFAR